jgi:hypothetical protein
VNAILIGQITFLAIALLCFVIATIGSLFEVPDRLVRPVYVQAVAAAVISLAIGALKN